MYRVDQSRIVKFYTVSQDIFDAILKVKSINQEHKGVAMAADRETMEVSGHRDLILGVN